METIVIALIVLLAVAGVGAKLIKDARRFNAHGPTDCGCGRGSACKEKPNP